MNKHDICVEFVLKIAEVFVWVGNALALQICALGKGESDNEQVREGDWVSSWNYEQMKKK